jgi:hypothetical protein
LKGIFDYFVSQFGSMAPTFVFVLLLVILISLSIACFRDFSKLPPNLFMTYMFVIRALVSPLQTVFRHVAPIVVSVLRCAFVLFCVYIFLLPMQLGNRDAAAYGVRVLFRTSYLIFTRPDVRRDFVRCCFTFIRANQLLLYVAFIISAIVHFWLYFLLVLLLMLSAINPFLRPFVNYIVVFRLFGWASRLTGYVWSMIVRTLDEYDRLLFRDGDLTYHALVQRLVADYHILAPNDFQWLYLCRLSNRFNPYAAFLYQHEISPVVYIRALRKVGFSYAFMRFWASNDDHLPKLFCQFAQIGAGHPEPAQHGLPDSLFGFARWVAADCLPDFAYPTTARFADGVFAVFLRCDENFSSAVPVRVLFPQGMWVYGIGESVLFMFPNIHHIPVIPNGPVQMVARSDRTPSPDVLPVPEMRMRRHPTFAPRPVRTPAEIEQDNYEFVLWCTVHGRNMPFGSYAFKVWEDVVCCLSALFGCGDNLDSEDAGLFGWRVMSDTDTDWRSIVSSSLSTLSELASDVSDDSVRLASFLVSLTQQTTPLGAASLVLATYPSAFRAALKTTHTNGQRVHDLCVAMFADCYDASLHPIAYDTAQNSPPIDSDGCLRPMVGHTVSDGPSVSSLISTLKNEFVVKLLLGDVFSSVLGVASPRLLEWLRKYVVVNGSLLGFVSSVLTSCHRVFAHLRYYVDGDLPRYLKSLDSMSALVFHHGSIQDMIIEVGLTADVLRRVEEQLPLADKLLIKLVKSDPDFSAVMTIRSALISWRQQITARLAGGDLPFTLMIVGPTRCGKSEFTERELPCIVAAHLRIPVAQLSVARPRASDQYDTEFKPTTHLALYQDPAKDLILQCRRESLAQLFDVASGQALAMTRAAIAEKGLYMAPPACIAITANLDDMRLDDGHIFSNHEALAARIPYGVWATWCDGHNEVTDPFREHVRWNLGRFSPTLYENTTLRPYDATKFPCGFNLTKHELVERLTILYDAHHARNAAYRASRERDCVQCHQCFKMMSMCDCVGPKVEAPVRAVAVSDPVTLVVAMPFYMQYTFILYFTVPLLSALLALVLKIFVFMKMTSAVDYIAVKASESAGTLYGAVCERVALTRDYVKTLPASAKSRVEQYARLEFLRLHRDKLLAGVGFAFLLVSAAGFWAWSKRRSGDPVLEGAAMTGSAPSSVPYPGSPVPSGSEMDVERRCARIQIGEFRNGAIIVDEHTVSTVAHTIGQSYICPAPAHVFGPFTQKVSFTAYPEAITVPADSSDAILVLSNRRFTNLTGRVSYKKYETGCASKLYLSGVDLKGVLHRMDVDPSKRVPISALSYTDSDRQQHWLLPGSRVFGLPFDVPPGTCGAILHDGVNVYGHVVAAMANSCAVMLFEPKGPYPFCVAHADQPICPLGNQDPVAFMNVRGCATTARHPLSMFTHERVSAHWDYRGTVEDSSHMKPRAVRTLGPDVAAIEYLSGIPASSLAESTGKSGSVAGVDHRVSPMEHMFDNHLRSQSLPSPVLDTDHLLDVKVVFGTFVREAVLNFRGPLTTDEAINGTDTITPMALDKSAGFPECAKRDLMSADPDTGRFTASVGLRARIEERYGDFLANGVAPPPMFRPFPKQGEILPAAKVAEGRARIIMNMLDLVQAIVVRRIMLPVLLNFVTNRDFFCMLIGLSATNPLHVAALAHTTKHGVPGMKSMCGDHNKLDLHQRFRIALMIMLLFTMMARRMGYSPELIAAVKRITYSWLFPNFVHRGDVWSSSGDIWGSGTLGTDVFQSLTTLILHIICSAFWERQSAPPPFVHPDTGMTDISGALEHVVSRLIARHLDDGIRVYGDDNARNHDGGPNCLTGEFIAATTLACGYEMTDAMDKTKPPVATDEISILKRTIKSVSHHGETFLSMPIEIKSIVKSLYWPKKGKDGNYDPAIYSSCIRNANRELFLHGEATFQKWYPTLMVAWSKQNNSAPLESSLELLNLYKSGTYSTWDSGGQLTVPPKP